MSALRYVGLLWFILFLLADIVAGFRAWAFYTVGFLPLHITDILAGLYYYNWDITKRRKFANPILPLLLVILVHVLMVAIYGFEIKTVILMALFITKF